MIVFLWLGNVVMGQYSVCPDPSTQLYQDCVNCIDDGLTWENDECIADESVVSNTTQTSPADERNADCGVTTITEDNMGSVQAPDSEHPDCCSLDWVDIPWLSPCDAAQMWEWNSCSPPEWWISNWIRCACPEWTKNVDGTCESCSKEWVCCWVSLNTKVPFIGNCIESKKEYIGGTETGVTWDTAFPTLMWALTQILVTIILIVSFVLIVVGGIMIATGNPSGGKKMIMKVVVGIALLWASWVILRLINPNFFG